MLFQFIAYPALCRTIGIMRLLRVSGLVAALVFLVIPDLQRWSWSERNSYTVGVTIMVLVECGTSVVSNVRRIL